MCYSYVTHFLDIPTVQNILSNTKKVTDKAGHKII